MKTKQHISRYSILLAIGLGYFLPVLGLTFYSNELFKQTLRWEFYTIGLATAVFGSLFFLWILSKWNYTEPLSTSIVEKSPEEVLHEPTDSEKPVINDSFLHELQHYKEENVALTDKLIEIDAENQSLKSQQSQTMRELESYQTASQKHLEQQQQHIRELQGVIAEQKLMIEKKQQQHGVLETKVNDLTYEIKTLLKLAESHVSSITNTYHPSPSHEEPAPPIESPQPQGFQIQTSEEASQQLKKCIDIAQKITGSHRFGGQLHSLIDSPIDSFTLDLRRLCETLRSESTSCILLYSPRENQLIFANNQIKTLTGWSPEKFTQAFFEIVQNSRDWQQSLSSLAMRNEAQIHLTLKTKWGNEVAVQGQVGMIPTGIFRQHAIAVLF